VNKNAFALALAAGLLVRAAVLPLPGAGDVDPWKVWSYHAVQDGVTKLYGASSPPAFTDFGFAGKVAPVNYPPLALYELAVAGWAYSAATGGRFPDGAALTFTLKLLPVIFEAGIVAALFFIVRRTAGEQRARWAAAVCWLNPAAIVCASVGGYLDTLVALPALCAVAAAASGRPFAAGALAACAVLTKPQGAIVLPAVLLAVWTAAPANGSGTTSRLSAAVAGGIAASAFLLTPFIAAGTWPNMILMLKTVADDQGLSMSAYNFWWLASHAMTAAYATTRGSSLWAAVTAPVSGVSFDRAAAHGLPHLRAVGTTLAAAAIAWALWIGRRAGDVSRASAIAAFSVCAYAFLATRVHENHAFLAIPLLVVAAAGRRRFTPVLTAISAWFTLNIVFYGITDDGRFAVSRAYTVVDTTLWVALLGCVSLAWFARVLYDDCAR